MLYSRTKCELYLSTFLLGLLVKITSGQVGLSDTTQARNKGFDWLLKEWKQPRSGVPASKSGGWTDLDTARILTSIQLVDNEWLFSPANKELAETVVRHMNSEILNGLLKSANMSTLSAEEGAEYVNAILATCQNPRDFFGHDLISMLTRRIGTIPSGSGTKNVVQVIAAVGALCHAGAAVPSSAIQRINSELKPTSGSCPYCVESSSLAILAMKCLKDRPGQVDQLVAGISTRQIAYVKGKQDNDGGFGDLFSTNLAIQAANAVGTVNLPINVAKGLEYIIQDQNKQTGSFGNPVLTSFILPTLIGRSILDVRSISCPATRSLETPIPSGQIRTTLVIEDTIYAQRRVETKVDTSPGKTILQVMNDQSAKHPRAFKFSTSTGSGGEQLTGLHSVVNDNKNNWSWKVQRTPVGGSAQSVPALDKVNVQNGDEILFRFGRA